MKSYKNLFIPLIAFIFSLYSHSANALLIDFDSDLPGAPAGADVLLTNQLQSLGVTFSTTDERGVVWHGPSGTGSFPYSISAGGVCTASETCGAAPIRVDIDSAITGAFSSVSITGFDGGGDIDTMVMNAFDFGGSLLDSIEITDVFTTPGLQATVTSNDIAWVTFEVTGTVGGVTDLHGLFFDDLCIGSCDDIQAVPEPTSLFLLGSGLLIFAFRLRGTTGT